MSHPDQWFGDITYSQHGEDIMLANIFKLLGVDKPSFLDLGAHHPVNISNTYLLYLRGSRGVNVEANPNLIANFHRKRPEDTTVNIGVGPKRGHQTFLMVDAESGRNTFSKMTMDAFTKEHADFNVTEKKDIEVLTLEDIVEVHCNNKWPHLVSMDVEGYDVDILRSTTFPLEGNPLVLCVELPKAKTPTTVSLMMVVKGFDPLCRMGENVIFIRSNLWRELT